MESKGENELDKLKKICGDYVQISKDSVKINMEYSEVK